MSGRCRCILVDDFFNKIILIKKMPDEWRKCILVPIYKNKGDIQSCTNYRAYVPYYEALEESNRAEVKT